VEIEEIEEVIVIEEPIVIVTTDFEKRTYEDETQIVTC
jgi:hypothetical protein